MTDHKHHLIENGTMLSCDASECPTQGKPFLLAGGDDSLITKFDDKNDPLTRLSQAIAEGIEANSKVKELEQKVNQLQKEIDELRRILAKGEVIVPR